MGLFGLGGGGARKAAQPYLNASNSALGQATGVGSHLGTLASGYGDTASMYGGQSRGAVQDYADYLGRGTTDTQRSALVGGLLGNTNRAYAQGESNLSANLAARGLGNSGSMAGGLAALEGQRAGAVAQAGNQGNLYADQLHGQNLQTLQGLYGGLENQYAGRQIGLLGQQAGIYGNAAQGYQGLGHDAANYAQQDEQANLAGIQGLIGAGAQLYGMGAGGGAAGMGGLLTRRQQPAQPIMPEQPASYPIYTNPVGYRY